MKEDLKTLDANLDRLKLVQRYLDTLNSSFQVKTYKRGDALFNKRFTKFGEAELHANSVTDEALEEGFNKIMLFNLSKEVYDIDLFDVIPFPLEELTLYDMINFLVGMGIKDIILFDLSCSVFCMREILSPEEVEAVSTGIELKEDQYREVRRRLSSQILTERNIRHTRRSILASRGGRRHTIRLQKKNL